LSADFFDFCKKSLDKMEVGYYFRGDFSVEVSVARGECSITRFRARIGPPEMGRRVFGMES